MRFWSDSRSEGDISNCLSSEDKLAGCRLAFESVNEDKASARISKARASRWCESRP